MRNIQSLITFAESIQQNLKTILKKFFWLFVSVILTGIALSSGYGFFSDGHNKQTIRQIEKTTIEKELKLKAILNDINEKIKNQGLGKWIESAAVISEKELSENDFALFIFNNDSLIYWSDNTIPASGRYPGSGFEKKLFFSGNAWFITVVQHSDSLIYTGLARIKYEYPYQNNFLKNSFTDDYNIKENWQIITEVSQNNITDNEGNFLFSVEKPKDQEDSKGSGIVTILTFAVILSLILFIYQMLRQKDPTWKSNIPLFLALLLVLTARALMIIFKFPDEFYDQDIFDPQYFGISSWFYSLGDFLVNSVLFFYTSFLLYRFFRFKEGSDLSTSVKTTVSVFLIFVITSAFAVYVFLTSGLILHSVIPFELFRIYDLNVYTFAGFIIITLLSGSFILLLDKTVRVCSGFLSLRRFIELSVIVSLAVFIILILITRNNNWFMLFFFYPILFLNSMMRFKKTSFHYSGKMLYLFIMAIIILLVIFFNTSEKEGNIKKVLAISLANERDPVAELLLNELEEKLGSDTFIKSQFEGSNIDKSLIYEHIQKNYLEGYWNKYDVQLFFCDDDDSIKVQPDNLSQNCRQFFSEIISSKGSEIQNPFFYFIDNFNGRINYLGSIDFSFRGGRNTTLYIDFNSKLITEELGYPELLLDTRLTKISGLRDFSYAKYKDYGLIAQSGDFQYSLSGSVLCNGKEEFNNLTSGDYDHLVYNAGKNYSIVISTPCIKLLDILISLSYILVFFHIVFSLSSLTWRLHADLKNISFGFTNKIRLTMIAVLLVSLILVGSGTVYYYIRQLENKNIENLNEKIQSVLVELEDKFINEHQIKSGLQDIITERLIRLSNVFYTDINVYDLKGVLIATSRPEIFEKALIGPQMNFEAYRQLSCFKVSNFIHDEKIGEMKYSSAYVPLINNNNKVLAYLNLPYFTKQSLQKREISAVVVAIVNIYVLLILITIVVAVIISNKITRPLQLIQEKVKAIRLRKNNEPILYRSNDEIGSLINDYNRMVVELARSAELLARSERETAWREMAKQIAHEIKNPLTPMKLNIQYLQKLWHEKSTDWEENFSKVTRNLIEQIDSLSAIASEFSHFAKLPKSHNREVEITGILEHVIMLFKNESHHIKFEHVNNLPAGIFKIFADKEQIQRVFINLVKNAIQSIPHGKQGVVRIITEVKDDNINITVADNGAGIPDELKSKIFEPNFTTKSGGMGLGLAITRSIIEDSGGSILFETSESGTSFIVSLNTKCVSE